MSSEVFNFIWVPGRKGNTVHIGPNVDTVRAVVHAPKEAVIMYPTLFTPAVYVDGGHTAPVVELLIAAKQELTPEDVNAHLKVSPGLDPEKAYDPRPLFSNLSKNPIRLESTSENGDHILHTFRRFSGILAEQVKSVYQPYSHIYKVELSVEGIRRIPSELTEKLSSRMTVGDLEDAVVGQEPQDISIANFLENAGGQGGAFGKVPGHRRYGFRIKDDGTVDLSRANPNEPVQSYHPLFIWTADLAVANFGHVSDIHVNSRLNLLRRNPARVVEDPVVKSPSVGSLLVDTNDSFASVLGQMQKADDVHALAVGGDLIDHIRNAYHRELFDPANPASVRAVWNAVDLGDAGRDDRYFAGVDYLLFYSMVVDFMRRSKKPIFGISGNHDTYEEPFGISPRVGSIRANGGIPSDLNLTFYEALLCFGPTWPTIVKKNNFNKDWWVWFYRVFGGFSDFVVRLPRQAVVGLGWGSQEDMLVDEQGVAHLPRSDDAITDEQLALLGVNMPPQVVMFTHFTVLSFNDPVPMLTRPGGPQTPGTLSKSLNDFNMGTFETNRGPVLKMFGESKIALIICGHSHRRGTYQLSDGPEKDTFSVVMHDTKSVGTLPARFRAPVVAVSDSAGPMPRLNVAGEFREFGSDVAGGTIAQFSSTGHIAGMRAVQAERARPRVCVAFDYLDVSEKHSAVFSGDLRTDWVTGAEDAEAMTKDPAASLYTFTIPLRPELLTRINAKLQRVTLHGAIEDAGAIKWLLIELQPLGSSGTRWSVPAAETVKFRRWANVAVESFAGLTFQSSDAMLSAHYNWADPWYFEVVTERKPDKYRRIQYLPRRPTREAEGSAVWDSEFKEIPDFDWRRKNLDAYKT